MALYQFSIPDDDYALRDTVMQFLHSLGLDMRDVSPRKPSRKDLGFDLPPLDPLFEPDVYPTILYEKGG